MIGVALKGLAARKVRALLTAFAVVIGVSMVSGTFILTDTMQKTFDGLFAVLLRGDRRRHRRQADRGEVHERLGHNPGVAAHQGARTARGRGGRGHGVADRGQLGRHHRPRRQSRRQRELGREHRFRQRALQPAETQDRRLAGGTRAGRDRRRHRREAALRARRLGARLDGRHHGVLPDHRHRLVRRRRLARFRQRRHLGRKDRPGVARPRRALRHDLDRREGRHVSCGTGPCRAAAHPGHARGQGQRQAGRGGVRGGRQGNGLHPVLPARLRSHRALRRRLRDLQHAVDHGGSTHPRVRDPADARRLAQAGPAVGPARGPRDRSAGVDDRARARVRDRQGHARAVQRHGRRPAEGRHRLRAAYRGCLAAGWHRNHAAGNDRAGAASDPGSPDRRGPRGLDAARRAARAAGRAAGQAACPARGLAGPARRWRRRRTGRRERHSQPRAHRVDRRRAHDRAHAGHARGGSRRRPQRVDQGGRQRPAPRRLRPRRQRPAAVQRRRRRRTRACARREGRLARARRQGARAGRADRRQRHRPGHDCPLLQV